MGEATAGSGSFRGLRIAFFWLMACEERAVLTMAFALCLCMYS